MGKVKLVIFDLDGTLHDGDFLIKPALKNRIHELQENGVNIAVCTGRELLGSLYFIRQNDIDFDALSPGGSSIVFTPNDITRIEELYCETNIGYIKNPGALKGKIDRIGLLMKEFGSAPNETLFIDDRLLPEEVSTAYSRWFDSIYGHPVSTPYLATMSDSDIGAPLWFKLVKDLFENYGKGYISKARGSMGTLECINYFINEFP